MSTVELFYSYSHKDERLRDELEKHLSLLKRQGVIRGWHDRRITGGKEWSGQIDRHLNSASVILLLVSADFLASDYCYDVEVKRAMERHESKEAVVIPVILRSVDWQSAPFGKLQGFPEDAKPVTSWTNQDEAFTDIAKGIRKAVEELTATSSAVSSRTTPTSQNAAQSTHLLADAPYDGFHGEFRELIAAHRVKNTGGLLHIVVGSIADIRKTPVVIPMGQSFDFWQRGPRSVLASFEKIRVGKSPFFEFLENAWPVRQRPKAAGLGHTKYLPLPKNSHDLPGIMLVVTTRDLSAHPQHYGFFVNTPIEGIDLIMDKVIESACAHRLSSIALPLLGTGYANIRRTFHNEALGQFLKQAVALLTIQKTEEVLGDKSSTLRRAVVVIYSNDPQGQEEHDIWEQVTRFVGSKSDDRHRQLAKLRDDIRALSSEPGSNT